VNEFQHPFQVFGFTHQLRLEQRFIQGISGTIPRIRYPWRYELERSPPNKSEHVIRVQLLFAIKGRHPSRGGS